MRQRIFWTIFVVCFGWVLLGLWASFIFFTNYYEKQILLHLQQNSHYIEIGLKQQGISYLSHINTAYRVSLIDSHGKVVYDNLALKEALDNHAERIEFKESMQNGVAQSYRYSQSMQQEMLYHAVKIMLEKRLIESSVSLETSSNFSGNLDSNNYALNPVAHPDLAKNLDSTPTSHANKSTNSSNCSMALEALAELEGRSYLSDMTIHHNLANRSNCIDKGENLANLDSKNSKTPTAEVSCDDFLKKLRFVGCEAFFARSYLSGSAEAKKANSRKITQETTQNLDSTPNAKNLQPYILRIASPHKNMPSLLYDTLPYMSLILLACLAVSFMLARSIANFIIAPLNALNLENPLGLKSYKELSPLLHKIDEQNRLIDSQIKQLQADKETFNAITQNMKDGFLLLDSKGSVLSFNKSSMKFFGNLHEGMNIATLDTQYKKWFNLAMQGEKLTEIIHKNDRTYQVIIESVLNSTKAQNFENLDSYPNGWVQGVGVQNCKILESNTIAHHVERSKITNTESKSEFSYIIQNNDTESSDFNPNLTANQSTENTIKITPIGVALLLHDITEKAQREQLRREFSANVSHELKTPLTSILAVLEMLQNNIIKQEDIPKFLCNIHKEARHLMALIEDIIILNELDNDYTFTPYPLSMRNLCEITLSMFKDSIQQKGLSCAIQGDDFLVMGEQRLLLVMLSHLCENAIKYNEDKGSIEIILDATHKTLHIKDSGIGIPEMYHERVFERFFCVDKSHSSMINGTGLGLSIVKHVAHLHHAKINLNSTTNIGTSISLCFS
ncbi:sensor histidine kinase [Helicobacter bilis]|uniref:sensor histidine kinase n=1 Tax=Helicobacter bilis TaxID=37372 RepID=UPI001F330735|nr:ATP-binding protein [Helicobacter bilis]